MVLGMFARDKDSNLSQKSVSHGSKSFIGLAPGVINTFREISWSVCPYLPLNLAMLLENKSGAFCPPEGAPQRLAPPKYVSAILEKSPFV